MSVPEPTTSFPRKRRDRPRASDYNTPAWVGDPPKESPVTRRTTINIQQTLNWIASVGKEDSADELAPMFALVGEALARNKLRGNRNAVKELPDCPDGCNFNGDTLIKFLKVADADDAEVLQQLYAAMRLRIRHAAWVRRKRK